jgi:hypothetical protein
LSSRQATRKRLEATHGTPHRCRVNLNTRSCQNRQRVALVDSRNEVNRRVINSDGDCCNVANRNSRVAVGALGRTDIQSTRLVTFHCVVENRAGCTASTRRTYNNRPPLQGENTDTRRERLTARLWGDGRNVGARLRAKDDEIDTAVADVVRYDVTQTIQSHASAVVWGQISGLTPTRSDGEASAPGCGHALRQRERECNLMVSNARARARVCVCLYVCVRARTLV